VLKTLEAAPLPAAVATGTMAQILDISRGARWRFEKFGGLRPQERFAKGRLMLASTKKKVQDGMLTYTKEVVPRSLLDLDSVLGKQAVSCHKCLLGFCGDRKTTYPAAAGHHVLMTGVQSVELRDEIFVQLCKHLVRDQLAPRCDAAVGGTIRICFMLVCADLVPSLLPADEQPGRALHAARLDPHLPLRRPLPALRQVRAVPAQLPGACTRAHAGCRTMDHLTHYFLCVTSSLLQGSACNDKAYGEYARYSLARLEEALDLVRATLSAS
jgi:hypothetical protein